MERKEIKSFDDIISMRRPLIRVGDFIRLCLDGNDDKVYIDLDVYGKDKVDYIEDLRVIDRKLKPYYDYEIIGIYTAMRIVLQVMEGR